jgi:16S rRNA (uracil1498-N3)-methyltransferase
VICSNTEKPGIKRDRINNLIISAMKQSLKSTITILNEPCRFNDFIKSNLSGTRMIAHCNHDEPRSRIGDVYSKGSNAVMMVGPEGDFSNDEIRAAVENGFKPVHLGQSRLRSETAGISACYSIYYLNQ